MPGVWCRQCQCSFGVCHRSRGKRAWVVLVAGLKSLVWIGRWVPQASAPDVCVLMLVFSVMRRCDVGDNFQT
eukprot:11159719-Lingulodinium_polyedra.AAC.1